MNILENHEVNKIEEGYFEVVDLTTGNGFRFEAYCKTYEDEIEVLLGTITETDNDETLVNNHVFNSEIHYLVLAIMDTYFGENKPEEEPNSEWS